MINILLWEINQEVCKVKQKIFKSEYLLHSLRQHELLTIAVTFMLQRVRTKIYRKYFLNLER